MSGPDPQYGQFPYGQPPPQQPPPVAGHRAPRRLPLPLLILAIGVPALLLGVALGTGGTLLLGQLAKPAASPTPSTIAVSGSVTLKDGFGTEGAPCSGDGGFNDIREGAQVVITDATQVTLAVGSLGAGKRDKAGQCEFAFAITAPTGHDFYGIEVSHRGRLQYSASQISSPLFLSLGD
ncbi:hypothetical protein ETD86_44160 [Nonomuraea turkmeniaca]|uniref:Uncharacterized protein n=1 Tax=Nonomuraea turkmeniaca TaxID=103838 RepID=A0A5S4EZR9_9ACTN|nr:hypothetical protein [Nonomuraea turkmeniaca]TMR09302.1 hypothetical protein ETD86_44160 [Nonomuraea turkmeniaca]